MRRSEVRARWAAAPSVSPYARSGREQIHLVPYPPGDQLAHLGSHHHLDLVGRQPHAIGQATEQPLVHLPPEERSSCSRPAPGSPVSIR